jgi:hypothetical protein
MASKSSTPSKINSQPAHTTGDDRGQERWKTRPSTEVTSDRGENAKRARERKHDENAPRADDPIKRDDR